MSAVAGATVLLSEAGRLLQVLREFRKRERPPGWPPHTPGPADEIEAERLGHSQRRLAARTSTAKGSWVNMPGPTLCRAIPLTTVSDKLFWKPPIFATAQRQVPLLSR